MDQDTLDKLKMMLGVQIDNVEDAEGQLLVYVPKGQAARAIGPGGSVVRSAELIINKKLTIKESGGV